MISVSEEVFDYLFQKTHSKKEEKKRRSCLSAKTHIVTAGGTTVNILASVPEAMKNDVHRHATRKPESETQKYQNSYKKSFIAMITMVLILYTNISIAI